MESTAQRITLPVFEGPLDLLLHLVKIDEVEITEISISEITRQYLDYLHAMAELDLEIAGEFLVMAATLMNIKLRTILPRPPQEGERIDEEEIDEILSTQDLVRRLVEYRRFKQIAAELRAREDAQSGIFYRNTPVVPIYEGNTLPPQDLRGLFDSFVKVLRQVRAKPEHHVATERFTVEEKLAELRERMRIDKRVNLRRVFETCVSKDEVICYFLSILELARLREITVAQADTYEDILIEPWDDKVVYVG
jgi:segregation and condensation protein A